MYLLQICIVDNKRYADSLKSYLQQLCYILFKQYFQYCDYEGKKEEKTKSPKFDGTIGRQFRDGLDLQPVINFNAINGKVPVYENGFINSLNNDSKYFYQVCHAIMSGNFEDDLVWRLIGHVHQARYVKE